MKYVRRIVGILMVVMVNTSSLTMLYAEGIPKGNHINVSQEVVLNSKQLAKYDSAFKELEKELRLSKSKDYSLVPSNMSESNMSESNIITKNIKEDDSTVTLGIIYSPIVTYAYPNVGITEYITHAKVKLTSNFQTSGSQIRKR